MTLSRLEVDCTAGSGSITRFTPAANGALYLVDDACRVAWRNGRLMVLAKGLTVIIR